MILSMTGYGKAEYKFANRTTTVEIRSLNSKQLDLALKVAPIYREKEAEIRAMLTAPLVRGKVDVLILTQEQGAKTQDAAFPQVNHDLFGHYLREIQALRKEYHLGLFNTMGTILRLPGVITADQSQAESLTDEEWTLMQGAIREAVDGFLAFRTQEGEALMRMFTEKLDGIDHLKQEVEPYEKGRVDKIKEHLMSNLDKLSQETRQQMDQNRLEAELIYYLEKLDITEEKVRLTNHIKYFRETMAEGGNEGVGKKLGFIAQEMGREINTLGSKSNQSEMQILVVKMKDILEQIKEQVLNVL